MPQSRRAPRDAVPREQSHSDIIRKIDSWGLELKQAHAELKGEMRGRFDGVDREIKGLRDSLERTVGRVAVLEGEHDHELRLPVSAEASREDGISFKKGWPRKLAISVMGITGLAALKAALAAMDAMGHAIGAAWHTLNTH